MGAGDEVGRERRAPLGLVVIGHVNHGKTALVRALTGTETDRLKEEKARGMSIALGFAFRDYPDGMVEVLDAPGHEDFIRAMVMGATGARAALLVVSAVEGFGRQTREHLRIAELLGIGVGAVAITKADLVLPNERAAMAEAVAAELQGGFLAGEPPVFCSATTGEGIEALHARLEALIDQAPPPPGLPSAWLPLDRVFTIEGAGAVGTGLLQGAPLAPGDEAMLLPSGRRVGLRLVQVHGQPVAAAEPGGRVAVGLRGVTASEVAAGETLCMPGAFESSLTVDVALTVPADIAYRLKSQDEVRVLWGARQDVARVRLLGPASVAPGETVLAQLRFRAPVVAHAGQRSVIRRLSPAQTLGGAVVLDPAAPVQRGRSDAREALLRAVIARDLSGVAQGLAARDRGTLDLAELARLGRCSPAQAAAALGDAYRDLGDRWGSRAMIAEVEQAYLRALDEAHRAAPARAFAAVGAVRSRLALAASRDMVGHVERALNAAGRIRLAPAGVALVGHDPLTALAPDALARLAAIEAAFLAGGMTPPSPQRLDDPHDLDGELVDLLVDLGRLVRLRNVALRQTLAFHPQALAHARAALVAAFPPPAAFATGEAREALATSRKFIVPVLEHFDDLGWAVRDGDLRRMTPLDEAAPVL